MFIIRILIKFDLETDQAAIMIYELSPVQVK
jgi:hypothetical protein